MRERLKHKYALSEQGVNDMIKAVIIVTIANLAFMVPVGLLYLLASDILNGGIPSSKLPMYIGGMVISILLIIITTYFQYNAFFIPRNLCGKWSQKTYTGREIKKDSIIIFR